VCANPHSAPTRIFANAVLNALSSSDLLAPGLFLTSVTIPHP
jgi:hypothetical protein